MDISSKLPDVGTTIFAVMSKMAHDHNAINLSQGFPDFPVNPKLVELVLKMMKEGKNQYAPLAGIPELLQSISLMVERRYGIKTDPQKNITVTTGATEGLYATFQGLVKKGDEVIILDPAYDSYDPAVRLSGGVPVHIPLSQPNFRIDWEMVKDSITSKTKFLILNTPHNPSGAVIDGSDLKQLEELAEKHDLIVISDEVYEWIIFDGLEHNSILNSEILRNRGLAIFSFGKTFHATGWKTGYIVAPEKLTNEVRKTHQFITFSVNSPVQYALSEFIREPENYEYLPEFFQKKRDFFANRLKDSAFEVVPCHGTYFQLLSYENISDKNDLEMAEWLTKEHKIASIPISVFYRNGEDNKMLRFCFAKNEETLKKATDILCRI